MTLELKNVPMFRRKTKRQSKDRKARGNRLPVWLNVVISYGLIAGAVYWVTTMPSRFFEPYCQARPSREIIEYYGTRLSNHFRESLIYSLKYRDIPFLEIGDRILVPFVDPGYEGDRMHGPARFLELIFGHSDESWSLTVRKSTGDAAGAYATDYPDSEIARLRERYFRLFELSPSINREELRSIKCDLTRRLVDPGLDQKSP